jgi:cysteine synthase
VTDDEALAWKRRLAGEEGLHVGFSAATNVCAAVKLLSMGAIPSGGPVATGPLRLGNEILTAVVVLAASLFGSMALVAERIPLSE